MLEGIHFVTPGLIAMAMRENALQMHFFVAKHQSLFAITEFYNILLRERLIQDQASDALQYNVEATIQY